MLYTVGKVLMSWVTFSKEHGSENQVFRSYFRFFVQNSDDVWIINDAVYAWGVHKLIQSVVYYQGLSALILWIIESCSYLASGMMNEAPTGHLLPVPPATYKIFETSSKCIYLPTNRCGILCWFQKCIPLYTYLADFSSYGHPKAEKGPFWGKRAFFGLKLTITLKICKIGIQMYTFLKSA